MSVAILLITHADLGHALQGAVRHVMPRLPLTMGCLETPDDADLSDMRAATEDQVKNLDTGAGVLVLTDLYGSTPCNLGLRAATNGSSIRCVSGVNLPMLVRVMNYPDKTLDELADLAASGGRRGICIGHA